MTRGPSLGRLDRAEQPRQPGAALGVGDVQPAVRRQRETEFGERRRNRVHGFLDRHQQFLAVEPADQVSGGVEGDDAAVVDDRDPVAQRLGLLR